MFVFVFVCVWGYRCHHEARERGLFRELHHHRATHRKSRPELPGLQSHPIAFVRAIQHAAHTNGTADAIFWCSAMQHTQPANMQMGSRFERLPA